MGAMGLGAALEAGDQLLEELRSDQRPSTAPTMGRLQKVRYTHEAMIDFIIENPGVSQDHLAAHFGFTPSWISNILASDSFQTAMARRKEEVVDPYLKASIEERFRALVIKSLDVLQAKLEAPVVSDQVALRAAELGAKALGIGGHAQAPPPRPDEDRLERLAGRLLALQANVRGVTLDESDGIQVRRVEETASDRQLRELQGPQPGGHEPGEGTAEPSTNTGGAG
jgi:hypothetical protein